MLYREYNLTSIDVWTVDTSAVTDMSFMFDNDKITSVNLSNFDTSSVTTIGSMFNSCRQLTSLDLSGFDTRNVKDMSCLVQNCEYLQTLNISNFNTSNVTSMTSMFYGCRALTSINIEHFDFSNVTSMTSMFYGCQALTSVTGFAGKDMSSCKSMMNMFLNCYNLKTIDFSGANLSSVTNMSNMFDNLGDMSIAKLETADFSGATISSVTDMSNMFRDQAKLTTVKGVFNGAVQNMDSMFMRCSSFDSITDIRITAAGDSINITRFMACISPAGVYSNDMNIFYGSGSSGTITSMDYAFTNQPNITTIDLYDFDINLTAAPTSAFAGCSALRTVMVKENEHILAALQTDLPDKN